MEGSLQGKPARLVAATAASATLYALAHPPWSWWPLALVAVAPVSAVLLDPRRRVAPGRAAAAGFLFGALATWLIVAHWSFLAASRFFPGSSVAAAAFTAGLPLLASGVAAAYALLFALLSRLAGLGPAPAVLGSAALWSAAELVRTWFGYGNPWAAFAASLTGADAWLSVFRPVTPVGDLLAFGGQGAVAMLAAAVGAAIGLAWTERGRVVARAQALATGAAIVLAMAAATVASDTMAPPRSLSARPAAPLRVAMVQPGVGRSRPWERAGAGESFERHVVATRSVDTMGADLVVWPENALPFLLDANLDKRDALRALARERGAALLVGGSRSSPGDGGRTLVFNSAFLFPADGSEPLVYDKRVLMPFVERVPAWASPFLSSPWQGAFAAGDSPGVFDVKGWRVAPLLCLEAIYPGGPALRVAEGADLLVNLSNDSWFDEGAGPEQDFQLAALRAAETRRPLLRVATTGVSALVGDDGLVAWRLPTGTGAIALVDVVPPARDSLFVRGGATGFPLLVFAIAAAAALLPAWTNSTAGGRR